MRQEKVIAVDSGNRNIKTLNHTFPASYMESGYLPSLGGDTIIYQDKEYILDVFVYPQAFAAYLTIREKVEESKIINIIDVGGYTVDLLQLTDFKPDMKVCTSLYSGANNLFNQINEVSRSKGKQNIPDAIIEGILLREPTTLHDASSERIELVQTQADRFARELLLEISNDRLDLTEYRTVFVGGGSILLKEHIEKTGLVSKPIFVDNVRANVEGYHLLYENLNPTHTQKEA